MAKCGKQPGPGRPKGSVTRPQLRVYFDEKERAEVVALLKKQVQRDPTMLNFVTEQIYGKAHQSIDLSAVGISLNISVADRICRLGASRYCPGLAGIGLLACAGLQAIAFAYRRQGMGLGRVKGGRDEGPELALHGPRIMQKQFVVDDIAGLPPKLPPGQ
jgi:hypothetical protein